MAEVARPDNAQKVAAQQRNTRAFDGNVGPRSHRDADVGGGQRRGIIDPVSRHGDDPALLAQPLDYLALLIGKDIGFDVVNAAGEKIAIRTSVAEDGRTLTGALARPLAAGAYRVDWRIASSDGHRMTGSYAFTVR